MPGLGKAIFGSGPDLPKSSSFVAPGFDIQTNRGGTTFTRTPTLGLNALNARFPRILSNLDTQRNSIRPGFGALTNAVVNTIRDRRTAALGTLKENLARRRVLGSSFGENAYAQVQRQFAQDEANARATSFLQELDAYNKSLTQEFNFIQTELGRDLAEAGLAANIGGAAQNLINGNLQFLKKQAADQAAQFDQFIGDIAGRIIGPSADTGGDKLASAIFA